ncbi:hypothetical protein [Kitasatospora sp. NPDC004272]
MTTSQPAIWVAWSGNDSGAPSALYTDKDTAQHLITQSYCDQMDLDPDDNDLTWETTGSGDTELLELLDAGESTDILVSPYRLLGPVTTAKPTTTLPTTVTGPFPTPQVAYATAPGIEDERQHIVWATRRFATAPASEKREFLLRRAAMSDRESLRIGDRDPRVETAAHLAALKLTAHDQVVTDNLRGYVRQQYQAWHPTTR